MSTPQPPRTAVEAPRADAEPINWDNVAVETDVMLRLQQGPAAGGAQGRGRDRLRDKG